jgi:two-component system LytT family response regulator
MIRVIIIDDEPLARSIVKKYISAFPEIEILEECNDGFEGAKAISQHKPDLIFLDIQMPKINGFEMLEIIDHSTSVIFTTAFDEFAIRAFEKNAIDYLLKPFSKERFDQSIHKFQSLGKKSEIKTQELLQETSLYPEQNNRIVVRTGTKVKIIPVHEIEYMESDDDFVKIVTAEGSFLKNKTLTFYENTLNPKQFIRVHRSHMVNADQVTKIEKYSKDSHLVILRNGQKIPVSKTGYVKLKEGLGI